MADAVPNKPEPNDKKHGTPTPGGAAKLPDSPPLPAQTPANDTLKTEPPKADAPAVAQAPVAVPPSKAPEAKAPETTPPETAPPAEASATAARAFNNAVILKSHCERSAFPRKPEKGFEKFLRLVGLGEIVDATKREERKAHQTAQAIFTKIGFGEIYTAATQPKHKVLGTLKAIGKKAVDMVAGRVVSTSFRLIAITFVAGMIGGVSGWGSIGLLALATGAASGIYTYGKEYLAEKVAAPKGDRHKVKIISRPRAISALKAFGSGAFNGAFGAWLANLPVFQSATKYLHDVIHSGVESVSQQLTIADPSPPKFASGGGLSRAFNAISSAAGFSTPQPPALPPMKPLQLGA